MEKSGDSFEIKKVKKELLPDVAKFLFNKKHCGYSENEWLDKFTYFWDNNPWFDEDKHCRGWVLVNYNQEIYGFIGNIPVVYFRDGKPEYAFCATTWVVSMQARSQSLKLYSKIIEQNAVILSTTTEPKLRHAITFLFGYDELEPYWLEYDYTIPLNLLESFKFISFSNQDSIIKNNILKLGCIFSKFVSTVYSFVNSRLKPELTVSQCSSVPEDIDVFNGKFISKYKYVLPRDKNNIGWLYFSGKQSSTRLVLTLREGSTLIGLVSFKCIFSRGVTRLELLDISTLYLSGNIIKKIITQVQIIAKKWRPDIAFVTFYSLHDEMTSELLKSGFYKTKGINSFFIRSTPLHSEIPEFHVSPIDGDRAFFP